MGSEEKAIVNDPHCSTSLRQRFQRGCAVCLARNPRKRATLVACGHVACLMCAEELEAAQVATDGTLLFACPHCRVKTGYVRLFEDAEDVEAESDEEENPDPRSRK